MLLSRSAHWQFSIQRADAPFLIYWHRGFFIVIKIGQPLSISECTSIITDIRVHPLLELFKVSIERGSVHFFIQGLDKVIHYDSRVFQ
ncbi:hypothetical protein NS274_20505 [Pseudomonas oryzihabitans]|nr:hypothetical protein NS274_20505 [Pseudomonas psychrotolerans]